MSASAYDEKGMPKLLVEIRLRHHPHQSFWLYFRLPARGDPPSPSWPPRKSGPLSLYPELHPGYHCTTLWDPSGCFSSPPSTLFILPVPQAPCSRKHAFYHKATGRHRGYHLPTLWFPSGCFSSLSSPHSQTTPHPYPPAPQSTLLLHFSTTCNRPPTPPPPPPNHP